MKVNFCRNLRTSLSYHLWTAQVEVDGVAVVLGQKGRLKEHLWIIGTKLKQERLEHLFTSYIT